MKKIYNNLFILFLLSLFAVACDDGGEEIVNLTNDERNITVSGISPATGYAGEELTINGTDFGVSKELAKVFIGQDIAEILSCEDNQIIVKVPEDATTGKISIKILDKEIKSDHLYTVLGKPSVTSIEPLQAFVGDQISFIGTNFGENKALIKAVFDGMEEPAKVISCENEKIVIEVPEGAASGYIKLQISQQKVNTPDEFTVLERATFTGLSPESGYRKSQVTLTGTNFGTDKSTITVLFGEKQATVVSCTNEEIVVTVPEDAEVGENVVTVKTSYETIETTQTFTVLPTPVVSTVSPANGYVGTEIVIAGNNFDTNTSNIAVLFGEASAEIISSTVNEIKLKVPAPSGGIFGEVDLILTVSGMEIYKGKFTINNSPVVSSAKSNNALNEELIQAGDVVTINGTELASSSVKVFIDGIEATKTAESATEIKVTVPSGVTNGKITLQFGGIPVAVEGGELTLLQDGTDITQYVLKNSRKPFADAEGTRSGNFASPADWIINEAALNCKKSTGAGLQGVGANALLSVQAGWDFNNMSNGKIYQEISLPAGKYEFTLDVAECGTNRGRFAVYFVVAKGFDAIPEIIVNTWVLSSTENVLGSYRITDNKSAHQKTLNTITLTENTQLSVGLVAQLTEQGWVKLSAISVKWKK